MKVAFHTKNEGSRDKEAEKKCFATVASYKGIRITERTRTTTTEVTIGIRETTTKDAFRTIIIKSICVCVCVNMELYHSQRRGKTIHEIRIHENARTSRGREGKLRYPKKVHRRYNREEVVENG